MAPGLNSGLYFLGLDMNTPWHRFPLYWNVRSYGVGPIPLNDIKSHQSYIAVGVRHMRNTLKRIVPNSMLYHMKHLRRSFDGIAGFYARDIKNFLRHGPGSPKAFQLLLISPSEINSTLNPKRFSEDDAGRVLPGDWDNSVKDLTQVKKWVTIYNALDQELRWEDSGMFELYSGSKKYSPDALKRRYEDLESVVERIRNDGYLKSRKDLSPFSFRERGGIMVHIGAQGNPIFSGDGYHRLALAKICQLPRIPVSVGVVHEDAVITGKFKAIQKLTRSSSCA